MVKIPVLRWGQPYESLENDPVIHFGTGETLAQGTSGPGITVGPSTIPSCSAMSLAGASLRSA